MIFSFEKKKNSFKYRWIDGILNSSYESFTKRDETAATLTTHVHARVENFKFFLKFISTTFE